MPIKRSHIDFSEIEKILFVVDTLSERKTITGFGVQWAGEGFEFYDTPEPFERNGNHLRAVAAPFLKWKFGFFDIHENQTEEYDPLSQKIGAQWYDEKKGPSVLRDKLPYLKKSFKKKNLVDYATALWKLTATQWKDRGVELLRLSDKTIFIDQRQFSRAKLNEYLEKDSGKCIVRRIGELLEALALEGSLLSEAIARRCLEEFIDLKKLRNPSAEPDPPTDLPVEKRLFIGRKEVKESIVDFVSSETSGFVLIPGDAGTGKTSLLRHLEEDAGFKEQSRALSVGGYFFHNRFARDVNFAFWRLLREEKKGSGLRDFAGYDKLEPMAELVELALMKQAKKSGTRNRPTIFLVDSLHEADDAVDFFSLLPKPLPTGVFFVVTYRPNLELETEIAILESQTFVIDLNDDVQNRKDIEKYLRSELPEDWSRTSIKRMSEGSRINFQFAYSFAECVKSEGLTENAALSRLESFGKRGTDPLIALYESQWGAFRRRLRSDPDLAQSVFNVLGLMLVGYQAFTKTHIRRFAGLALLEIEMIYSKIAQFIQIVPDRYQARRDQGIWQIRHETFSSFLSEYFADDLPEFHELIANFYGNEINWATIDSYGREYLVRHLSKAGMVQRLSDLLTADYAFGQIERTGSRATLLEDVAAAIAAFSKANQIPETLCFCLLFQHLSENKAKPIAACRALIQSVQGLYRKAMFQAADSQNINAVVCTAALIAVESHQSGDIQGVQEHLAMVRASVSKCELHVIEWVAQKVSALDLEIALNAALEIPEPERIDDLRTGQENPCRERTVMKLFANLDSGSVEEAIAIADQIEDPVMRSVAFLGCALGLAQDKPIVAFRLLREGIAEHPEMTQVHIETILLFRFMPTWTARDLEGFLLSPEAECIQIPIIGFKVDLIVDRMIEKQSELILRLIKAMNPSSLQDYFHWRAVVLGLPGVGDIGVDPSSISKLICGRFVPSVEGLSGIWPYQYSVLLSRAALLLSESDIDAAESFILDATSEVSIPEVDGRFTICLNLLAHSIAVSPALAFRMLRECCSLADEVQFHFLRGTCLQRVWEVFVASFGETEVQVERNLRELFGVCDEGDRELLCFGFGRWASVEFLNRVATLRNELGISSSGELGFPPSKSIHYLLSFAERIALGHPLTAEGVLDDILPKFEQDGHGVLVKKFGGHFLCCALLVSKDYAQSTIERHEFSLKTVLDGVKRLLLMLEIESPDDSKRLRLLTVALHPSLNEDDRFAQECYYALNETGETGCRTTGFSNIERSRIHCAIRELLARWAEAAELEELAEKYPFGDVCKRFLNQNWLEFSKLEICDEKRGLFLSEIIAEDAFLAFLTSKIPWDQESVGGATRLLSRLEKFRCSGDSIYRTDSFQQFTSILVRTDPQSFVAILEGIPVQQRDALLGWAGKAKGICWSPELIDQALSGYDAIEDETTREEEKLHFLLSVIDSASQPSDVVNQTVEMWSMGGSTERALEVIQAASKFGKTQFPLSVEEVLDRLCKAQEWESALDLLARENLDEGDKQDWLQSIRETAAVSESDRLLWLVASGFSSVDVTESIKTLRLLGNGEVLLPSLNAIVDALLTKFSTKEAVVEVSRLLGGKESLCVRVVSHCLIRSVELGREVEISLVYGIGDLADRVSVFAKLADGGRAIGTHALESLFREVGQSESACNLLGSLAPLIDRFQSELETASEELVATITPRIFSEDNHSILNIQNLLKWLDFAESTKPEFLEAQVRKCEKMVRLVRHDDTCKYLGLDQGAALIILAYEIWDRDQETAKQWIADAGRRIDDCQDLRFSWSRFLLNSLSSRFCRTRESSEIIEFWNIVFDSVKSGSDREEFINISVSNLSAGSIETEKLLEPSCLSIGHFKKRKRAIIRGLIGRVTGEARVQALLRLAVSEWGNNPEEPLNEALQYIVSLRDRDIRFSVVEDVCLALLAVTGGKALGEICPVLYRQSRYQTRDSRILPSFSGLNRRLINAFVKLGFIEEELFRDMAKSYQKWIEFIQLTD